MITDVDDNNKDDNDYESKADDALGDILCSLEPENCKVWLLLQQKIV